MNKSIFVTRQIPEIGIKMLQEIGYIVDFNDTDKALTKQELITQLKSKPYDAVLSVLTDKIDKEVYDSAPNVKIFSNYAIGYDNIDITEAKVRDIVVTNTPSLIASSSVAEHTIALILALAKRIVEADDYTRAGKYTEWSPMSFIGSNLEGKVLGLVGAGRIGERVAALARGLNMEVIYTDTNKNDRLENNSSAYYSSLEELLPKADFVSLHVPLLPSTKHLINEGRLGLMKKTAFLINTSRGLVVDEASLEVFLRENRIAGAGLDVYEFEPKISAGLKNLANVILTPHIASASIEARNEMSELAANNIIDFFEGREMKNIVNK